MKNQLTQELQHLTQSFGQLKQAQAKFRDCGGSVRDGLMRGEGEWLSSFGWEEGGGKGVGEGRGGGKRVGASRWEEMGKEEGDILREGVMKCWEEES